MLSLMPVKLTYQDFETYLCPSAFNLCSRMSRVCSLPVGGYTHNSPQSFIQNFSVGVGKNMCIESRPLGGYGVMLHQEILEIFML